MGVSTSWRVRGYCSIAPPEEAQNPITWEVISAEDREQWIPVIKNLELDYV
jgi:hypothetical protein